ncbi:hypothetical protein D3C79_704910 [compost metagenome]
MQRGDPQKRQAQPRHIEACQPQQVETEACVEVQPPITFDAVLDCSGHSQHLSIVKQGIEPSLAQVLEQRLTDSLMTPVEHHGSMHPSLRHGVGQGQCVALTVTLADKPLEVLRVARQPEAPSKVLEQCAPGRMPTYRTVRVIRQPAQHTFQLPLAPAFMMQLECNCPTHSLAQNAQCRRTHPRYRPRRSSDRRQALHQRCFIDGALKCRQAQGRFQRVTLALLEQGRNTSPCVSRRSQLCFKICLVLPTDIQRTAALGKGPGRHGQSVALGIQQLRLVCQPQRPGFSIAEVVQRCRQQAVLQGTLANTTQCFWAGGGVMLDQVHLQGGLAHIQ